jgi:DNA repair exonuclease SbcCD nuclease subunit
MANLFKKAAVFTDIHFGLKSNSIVHNTDCENFVDWFIAQAKAEGCETGLFLGDWHNHRASINLQTLHSSLKCLEKLNAAFDKFYLIPGNHDLYYRDRRDIHGVEWAQHLPNIEIVNDWFNKGGVVIAPWLVGDDHKKLQKMSCKYMFGHFELPSFLMNARVAMPDHGEVKIEDFTSIEKVFSGHFHMRQQKGNIRYIGNCFPHNFADAGDTNRGMMVLEWGKDEQYYAWPNQPLYRVVKLSEAIDQGANIFAPNMHVRVELDIDISYEEANFIKETFIKDYNLREMSLIPTKKNGVENDLAPGEVRFESVDQIVTDQITNIESEFYDNSLLLKIYQSL